MLYCRSISHQNTPLGIREQLDLSKDQQIQWLTQLENTEAVVLCTCNRLELYAYLPTNKMDQLWSSLLANKGIDAAKVAPYTVKLNGYEVAHHLFRVASSLKSLALGETQILGQITSALEQAQICLTSGHALSMLFRSAIHAAKRVQSETLINQGHVSVSSLGISRVEQVIGSLHEKTILVIGAGEMGQAVIKGLDRRHLSNVTLVSRTYETACQVAETWGIQARPITYLKELLLQSDVVFTTSSAPFPILNRADIEPIMQTRPNRPLYLVDIALPRDVAADVSEISGVHIYDLDDLAHVVEDNWQEREKAIPLAEGIIDEELVKFWNGCEERSVDPTIRQLRAQAEMIRAAELERIINRLNDGDPEKTRLLLEEFSHRFMNKILHQPTQNLKVKARQGSGSLFSAVARDLFGLEDSIS